MKYRTSRGEEPQAVIMLVIYIGENKYRIEETNENRLKIIKVSDGGSDAILLHPCVSNVVEIF